MAAAAKKTDPLVQRRALAVELVGIHKKHAKDLARADELKTALKNIATDTDNFREVVEGVGKVSVSGEKGPQFKGNVPTLVPEAWNALTPAKQQQLVDRGLVKIEPSYSGA